MPDRIFNDDCEKLLNSGETWDCIIADPPDNLGLQYDTYKDQMPPVAYYSWLNRLILKSMHRAPVVWWSIYHEHDFPVKMGLGDMKPWKELRTFIWRYTFGQNQTTDCTSGYRPILRISDNDFEWDTASIKVPSWRMEHGDKRAAGPRVPDDVWDFPRVCGNFPERRSWHKTQHPEALYIRMLKMVGATQNRPFKALDLFGGSGTLLRVARQLRTKNPQFHATVCEIDSGYCRLMRGENPGSEIE